MPRLHVVFDANGYRSLSDTRFEDILALERQHSVVGMASYTTVGELASHLANERDPDYRRSAAALRRLARHTTGYDGARLLVRFLADAEEQLCNTLFGATLANRLHLPDTYGRLVGVVAGASGPENLAAEAELISGIAAQNRGQEEAWARAVFEGIVAAYVPDATTWTAIAENPEIRRKLLPQIEGDAAVRQFARMMAQHAAATVGRELTDAELTTAADMVVEAFGIPLRLIVTTIRDVVADGLDLSKSKHANTVWDLQVVHCISPVGRIDGRPGWLVTDDARIHRAARGQPAALIVRSLEEYEGLLKDGDSLMEQIQVSNKLGRDH